MLKQLINSTISKLAIVPRITDSELGKSWTHCSVYEQWRWIWSKGQKGYPSGRWEGGHLQKLITDPSELPTCPSCRHPTRQPCLFLVRTRFKRGAVGFTAKEVHMMVLSAFIALNILIGASPMQRLISSRETFWPL